MSRTRRIVAPVRVNGRALTGVQAAALGAASRADAAGQIAHARQLRQRLEAQLGERADADWLAGALAETAALERARGAVVEHGPGRIRIHGRDGLLTLRETGALSEHQVACGLRYRDRFETAQPRTGSALAIRPGDRGGRPDVPECAAARLAQARRDQERMERAVADHYARQGRPALAADALLVLREVAGLGRTVRALASSGARRAALAARLGEALDAVERGQRPGRLPPLPALATLGAPMGVPR